MFHMSVRNKIQHQLTQASTIYCICTRKQDAYCITSTLEVKYARIMQEGMQEMIRRIREFVHQRICGCVAEHIQIAQQANRQ